MGTAGGGTPGEPKTKQKKPAKQKPERPPGEPSGAPTQPHKDANNALFEQCYRGVVVPEGEWEDFRAALRRELPVTFRFTAAHPLSAALAAHLETAFASGLGDMSLPSAEVDELPQAQSQEPLKQLPWLAGAWRLDLPKVLLRRAPGPKKLHALLKRCTELGAISRQEAVSMVPVTLLGCKGGMRCLDTCASPGMKTLQMIDAHAATCPQEVEGSWAVNAVRCGGVVVANELDGRRCCMLAHHVLRARHPAAVVIHHSAVALPPLCEAFDRVLCDVPCSGDGTIRKAPQLLTSWRPNRSHALHGLQLRIACAGAGRLRVGGRMVYSTCALSPIENEAVVAALLLRARGGLQLVDCEGALPGLDRRPGLEDWEVRAGSRHCRSAATLQNPAEAQERGLEVPASAWPPSGAQALSLGLPGVLQRCWRLYPHLGDGGGFFVALLERTELTLPADFIPPAPVERPVSTAPADTKEHGGEEQQEDGTPGGAQDGEELPEDAVCKEALPDAQREANLVGAGQSERIAALLKEALKFYGLEEALPQENFFVRTDGDGRNVYLVSDALRDLLDEAQGSHVLVAGVRVFDENRFLRSSGCRLRLAQEGVRWLAPVMQRRRCFASCSEMLRLLDGEKVVFSSLDEHSPLRVALELLDAQGSVVISCSLAAGAELHAAAERGAECLSLFVNKQESRELRDCLLEYLQPSERGSELRELAA